MPVNANNIDDVFRYHAPSLEETQHISAIREAGKAFAAAILDHAPQCADQQAAIRHVREALMTANAAIVLEGLI